jgi:hypothetical protein
VSPSVCQCPLHSLTFLLQYVHVLDMLMVQVSTHESVSIARAEMRCAGAMR